MLESRISLATVLPLRSVTFNVIMADRYIMLQAIIISKETTVVETLSFLSADSK
jgi:hypothetical protein